MPRTEKQFSELRKQKREHIMRNALELFAEKGFDATSINMIASRAKISKGLIYNYFESKEDLIIVIIHDGFDTFLREFDQNNDGIITNNEVINFLDVSFDLLRKNLGFWKLYFMVVAQPQVLKLVENKLMEMVAPFIEMLTQYYERKGYENPGAHARLFGALMDGIMLNYIAEPKNFPVDEIKKIITTKLI